MMPTPRKLALLMSIAGLGASLGEAVQARTHATPYAQLTGAAVPFAAAPDALSMPRDTAQSRQHLPFVPAELLDASLDSAGDATPLPRQLVAEPFSPSQEGSENVHGSPTAATAAEPATPVAPPIVQDGGSAAPGDRDAADADDAPVPTAHAGPATRVEELRAHFVRERQKRLAPPVYPVYEPSVTGVDIGPDVTSDAAVPSGAGSGTGGISHGPGPSRDAGQAVDVNLDLAMAPDVNLDVAARVDVDLDALANEVMVSLGLDPAVLRSTPVPMPRGIAAAPRSRAASRGVATGSSLDDTDVGSSVDVDLGLAATPDVDIGLSAMPDVNLDLAAAPDVNLDLAARLDVDLDALAVEAAASFGVDREQLRPTRVPGVGTGSVARSAPPCLRASCADAPVATAAEEAPAPLSQKDKVLRMLADIVERAEQAERLEAEARSATPSVGAVTPVTAGAPARGIVDAPRPAKAFPLGEAIALSETSLDQVRGGFQTDNGMQMSFGIERAVYINGNLITTTSINLAGGGPAGIQAANAAANNLTLIQNGAGNTFLTGPMSAAAVGTVVQNTLDDQRIQNVTSINATVNSLQAVRAQNFESSLRGAIVDSLRR